MWSVVVNRGGGVSRDISTVTKNAYQWMTSALSRRRWAWRPLAVMGYCLWKCDALCAVCFPDRLINGDRRVIFNSGNDVDHNMLTQGVHMVSLSVVLIAVIGMPVLSSVSTVALSVETSGGGSTVKAELVSLNSCPGQRMGFGVCLRMEACSRSGCTAVWICGYYVNRLPSQWHMH